MKKRFKILLIVLIVMIVIPVITLFTLSKIHHQSTHDEVLNFINSEFDGKVVFQGFSFSYIRHFPKAHIKLMGVTINDGDKTVGKIGELNIHLNTWSLWRKKIKVENLIINDAEFYSIIDSLGNKTRILAGKSKKSDSTHKALLIEAENIVIQNSQVYFENQVKGNRTSLQIRKAQLDLETIDSNLVFKGNLDGFLDSLVSNHKLLFSGQPVQVHDLIFKTNQVTGYKELESGYLMAHNLKLIPRLIMRPEGDGQIIELHISGEDNFDTFLDLFQFHTGFDLQQVNPEAKLNLTYNQSGFVNPFKRPYSELDFEITDAEFSGENLPFPIKISDIKGNYNNGENHSPETVELDIDTIHATVNESYIHGRFSLKNLKDPVVDAHLISFLDLSHLIKETKNFKLLGTIDFDVLVAGKISELKKENRLGEHKAKGTLNVHNLKLILKEQEIDIDLLNGSTLLENEIFEVSSLVGAFNEAAFHFHGKFENWDHYFFDANESMAGRIELKFEELDLTKTIFGKSTEKTTNQSSLFPLSQISLEIIVNGKKLITDAGIIENFKMSCLAERDKLKIGELDFKYQDGIIHGNADVTIGSKGISGINAYLKGRFKNLDLDLNSKKQDTVAGEKTSFHFPEYVKADLDFLIEKGTIQHIPFKNFSLLANIKNNEVSISKFEVDAFDGSLSATGKFKIDSTGLSKINMDAGLTYNHLDIDQLLTHFHKDNSVNTNRNPVKFPEQINLNLNLVAAHVVYKDAEISRLKTRVKATDKQIDLIDFYADLPFGNLTMDVSVKDYRNDKIKYSGSVNLVIDSLEVHRFLELEAFGLPGSKDDEVVNKTQQNERPIPGLPQNINLDLNIDAGYLSYKNAVISNANLKINYEDNRIDLHKLKFQFAGGTIDVHGHILKDKQHSYPGYLYSNVDNIGIPEFFRSFNNFNQDVITDNNSIGKISWTAHYYFEIKKDFSLDPDGNLLILNTRITDAEFDEVEPIEKTLFFVGHKSKDRMMVKDLKVNAFLYKKEIYFMDVLMNNNIANLDVYGEVDLGEKELNVGIEVSLSDLFFRSRKSRLIQTEGGEIDLEHDSKVFLKMEGALADNKLSMINKNKFNKTRKELLNKMKKAEKAFLQIHHQN